MDRVHIPLCPVQLQMSWNSAGIQILYRSDLHWLQYVLDHNFLWDNNAISLADGTTDVSN